MYLNKEICAKCKGQCCKQSGCMLSTRDITGLDTVKKLLAEKAIVICSIEYTCFALYAISLRDSLDFMDIAFNEEVVKKLCSLKKYNNVYIIKTRSENQGVFERIVDPNTVGEKLASGKCVFLTDTGCLLNDTERPFGGLQLEPDIRGIKYCKPHFSAIDLAIEWLEFHEELDKIFEK